MNGSNLLRACGLRPTFVVITSDAYDVNLKTLAGNPGGIVQVIATVNPGVVVGQSTGVAAMRTGGFAAGSEVRLTVQGSIFGKGGNGQADGGDALYLDDAVELDNQGAIFGGGGGGSDGPDNGFGISWVGGGGGGGGQGNVGGTGNAGHTGSGASGSAGGNGNVSGPGAGGAGAANGFYGTQAGSGGAGGTWGMPGSQSGPDAGGGYYALQGAGGYAIRANGKAITWISGNNAAQVKGTVG